MWYLALVFSFFTLSSCYTLRQSYVQGKLLLSAQEVNEYRASENADQKTLIQLEKLDAILAFASDNGIPPNGSYEKIVFPASGKISFLGVSAPYNSLKPHKHWFPFVGTVPYLGFFSEKDRDEYLRQQMEDGHDVYASDVGAFSLLGYLDDPVFPSMLFRRDESMAHLFFHELTHKNIWIAGDTKFNERLAEFVATKLTKNFLIETKNFDALKRYQFRNNDRELFNLWFKELKEELTGLYNRADLSRSEVEKKKSKIFDKFFKMKPDFLTYDLVGEKNKWNNARVAITSTYGTDFSEYERALACVTKFKPEKEIAEFLNILNELIKKNYESSLLLDRVCEGKLIKRKNAGFSYEN